MVAEAGGAALAKLAGRAGEDVEAAATHEASTFCPLSFGPSTLVSTPKGKQSIASLKVGDKVVAYDPKTGKATTQTVEQTYITQDTGLLDVTLRPVIQAAKSSSSTTTMPAMDPAYKQRMAAVASHGSHAPPSSASSATKATTATTMQPGDETIHTTANHPWLTSDRGWIVAGHLQLGEPVQRVDGSVAVVVALTVVHGTAPMWDLTVSAVHDFAVGSGACVAHNGGTNNTFIGKRLPRHVDNDLRSTFGARRSAASQRRKSLRFLCESRAPSAYGRSVLNACRHSGVYVLLPLLVIPSLVVVTGCAATTSFIVSPTAVATATIMPPAPTVTPAPEDAFRDEIAAISGLRGQVPASRLSFEVERLANVTIVHVVIQLASPALPDVQWDAFLVQRALWLGQEFAIPDSWEVSVEFFVPPSDAATQTLGREIGVANLRTASARRLAWGSLSPQQGWSRYDSIAFNQNGL